MHVYLYLWLVAVVEELGERAILGSLSLDPFLGQQNAPVIQNSKHIGC